MSSTFIDVNDGLKRVGGNAKLYARLLTSFRNNTRENELVDAINAKNSEAASHAAHTIKGVAANLSLIDLRDYMQNVELQMKTPDGVGAVDLNEVSQKISETVSHVDEALKGLGV